MLRRKSLFSGISEQEVRFPMSGAEDFKDIVTVTLVTASYNALGSNLYFNSLKYSIPIPQ